MAKPIFIFATQRSGTNFLRRSLASDERIVDLNEVFLHHKAVGAFWRFKRRALKNDSSLVFPTAKNMSKLFESYFLEHLNTIDADYALVDVKYNSAHHLNTVWHSPLNMPFLLKLIERHNLPVVHLVRRNVLETYVSSVKAKKSGQYIAQDGANVKTLKVKLNASNLIDELARRTSEIEFYEKWLGKLELKNFYPMNYEEILGLNSGDIPESLQLMLDDMDINTTNLEPGTVKLGRSLDDTVKNYNSEVVPTLLNTEYDFLLDAA